MLKFLFGCLRIVIVNAIGAVVITGIIFILGMIFTAGSFSGDFWYTARWVFYVLLGLDILVYIIMLVDSEL